MYKRQVLGGQVIPPGPDGVVDAGLLDVDSGDVYKRQGVARLILQRPVERVGADKLLQRRCFLVVLLDAFDDLQDG